MAQSNNYIVIYCKILNEKTNPWLGDKMVQKTGWGIVIDFTSACHCKQKSNLEK